MYHIIIAEFKHETNTFSIQPTGMAAYRNRIYAEGHEMVRLLSGTATEIGGVLDVLGIQPDVCLLPVICADAMPAGPVTAEVYNEISFRLIQAIQAAGKVDGILLCLHGAMVTENSEDGEGDLIELVRKSAGDETMIIATLDLHANITHKMQQYADVLINYDYYPHTDMYERGKEAAQILLRTLHGEIKPVMVCATVPIILPPLSTCEPVMQKFVEMVHAFETMPGVQTVSIAHGFPCADIHELGMTVVAVTDNDHEQASRISTRIAAELWHDRRILKPDSMHVNEAIDEAEAAVGGPVIIADLTDNPGGGSTCDGTHILRAMIARNVKNAAVAHIYDPDSVARCEAAGVGQTVKLCLGGKGRPDILGYPIECEAYVRLICDGRYKNRGPMSGGVTVDLHKSAVVMIGDIAVIVSSNVTQPHDLEIFYAHGIDPCSKHILLVKSTNHFKAAFNPIAMKVLNVAVPGLLPQDPLTLNYVRCRRPIYPLDDMLTYVPQPEQPVVRRQE